MGARRANRPDDQAAPVKALVVRAPWCFDIADGTKRIEYRSRRTHYRGPVVIAAAKRKDSGECAGRTVCVVWLVDCIQRGPKDFEWIIEGALPVDPQPVAGRLGIFDTDLTIPANWTRHTAAVLLKRKPLK